MLRIYLIGCQCIGFNMGVLAHLIVSIITQPGRFTANGGTDKLDSL